MANFDKEMWKKHHFWILLVPVTLAVLVGTVGAFFSVPDEIEKKWSDSQKNLKELEAVKAQPKVMTTELKKQADELKTKRDEMCKAGWNDQKDLFVWPRGYSAQQLNDFKNLKFGDEIPDKEPNYTLRQFRDPPVYHQEYKDLVKSLAPMGFREDWQNVLRYIPHQWPKTANSEDAWLAMEDLWVQRDILHAIQKVNTDAAIFQRIVKDDKGADLPDDPKHRRFRSRIWEADLQLIDKGNEFYLEGKLKNISDRLQVTGIYNTMTLNVRLAKDDDKFFPCIVEGVSAAKGETLLIKAVKKKEGKDLNVVPVGFVGSNRLEIFSVEQVFDLRTVPVKRIERLVLGKLSDRNSAVPLRMAKFSEVESKKDSAAPAGKDTRPAGLLGTGIGMGNESSSSGVSSKSQNGLERIRYVDATDQVRRLPFAVAVVTDQTYMKDLLESLANSRLRFQTTQVDLTRFHGSLNYDDSSTSTPADDNKGVGGPPGLPRGGRGFTGSESSQPSNSREDQFSANLLELSVYGILSIFERYSDEKKPKTADKAPAPTPNKK